MGRPLDPDSKHWQAIRGKIIERDKHCFVCQTRFNLTAHHIKPRSLGGKTNERNLIALCNKCHNYVEEREMEWPAIINLRREKSFELSDRIVVDKKCRVGRDKFGVFIIRDEEPSGTITYDGVWPVISRKVEPPSVSR